MPIPKLSAKDLAKHRAVTEELVKNITDHLGEVFMGEFIIKNTVHRGHATFADPKRPSFRIIVNRHSVYVSVNGSNLFESKTRLYDNDESLSLLVGEINNARVVFDAAMEETVKVVRKVESELNEELSLKGSALVTFGFLNGLPALFFCGTLALKFRPQITVDGEETGFYTVLTDIPDWAQFNDDEEDDPQGFILNRDSERLGALLKMLRNVSDEKVQVYYCTKSNSISFRASQFTSALPALLEVGYSHISQYTANILTVCDDKAVCALMPMEPKTVEMVRVRLLDTTTEEQVTQHFAATS